MFYNALSSTSPPFFRYCGKRSLYKNHTATEHMSMVSENMSVTVMYEWSMSSSSAKMMPGARPPMANPRSRQKRYTPRAVARSCGDGYGNTKLSTI